MSAEATALQTAKDKVNDLLEAAQKGAIVPVRLPAQIEEIANLLQKAEKEQKTAEAEAARAASAGGDDADDAVDEAEFVGHAVHELNTPLTSIRGYVDMVKNVGELNDMQTQFMGVVKTNAQRMETLLSDFRYMNKLRHGVLRAEPKMDTFKNIAMKVEKKLQKRADELNRELEFDIPQGLPLLEVDSEWLGIALVKLAENGLQYSPEGEGKVTVKGEADGNTLVIKIIDNGIGISEDDQARLGELYFRSEDDRVREFKGSGLGVPLAYGMLDLIGADVEVDSEPDEGTTFIIRIEGMS
jgi:two-component system phosphate regulon sensor histidine kinase PhoR